MNENPFEGWQAPLSPELASRGFAQDFVTVDDGVVLSYLHGPAHGTPLVLIPAQMGTWQTYAQVAPELSDTFEVFAIDVPGHGSSSWTPGDYTWDSVGGHLRSFLQEVVKRPAIIAGNSSGGIFALWLAANVPELVAAIVLEDAPVFSVEWPRFRDRDKFVYNGLAHQVQVLEQGDGRRLADYFKGQELPVSERRVKRFPDWAVGLINRGVRRWNRNHPGEPSGFQAWWAPASFGDIFRSMSMFDPDFARSFVDGRMYCNFSHEEALRSIKVPILVMHGHWMRLDKYGLVGALDDQDVARIVELAPQTQVRDFPKANHVIHRYDRKGYTYALRVFAESLPSARKRSGLN